MLRGAAVEFDITPPVGAKLAGYASRTEESVGIHDPLMGQVLMLESTNHALVIVSLDLIAVSTEFTGRLRKILLEELKIDPKNVMIACAHTHSGPEGFLTTLPFLREQPNPLLEEITLQKIVGGVKWANKLLQPVQLLSGNDWGAGIGLNRNDPVQGSVDQQLSVLRVDDESHHPIAILFNYGCHPTVMGGDNYLISADFPGAARNFLKKAYPDTKFLFCNGGSGDVSTRFSRREASFGEVERLGQLVAASVLKATHTAQVCQNQHLASKSTQLDLPVKEFPDESLVKQSISESKETLEMMQKQGEPQGELRKLITKIEGAEIQLFLAHSFGAQKTVSIELQAFTIGDYRIFSIPGEPFSKTVIDIKEYFTPQPVMVISYSNGYAGYLPEHERGESSTYEDFVSPYTSEAAKLIKTTIFSQLADNYG